MELSLDEIARSDISADGLRVQRTGDTPPLTAPATRSGFLQRVLGVGMGVGLSSLTIFPQVKEAIACGATSAEQYFIFPESLTSGPCRQSPPAYAFNHQCSPGCGDSPVSSSACTSTGWHRCCGNFSEGAFWYHRPNECWAPSDYDGWKWRCSSTVLWRCHDGCACAGGGCGPTVCRWNVD